MNKEKTKKLINQKIDLYENADNELLEELKKFDKEIYLSVIKILAKFETKSGKIDPKGRTNAKLQAELKKRITLALQKSSYKSKVQKFLLNFDQLEILTKQINKEVNKIPFKEIEKLISGDKKEAIRELTDKLTSDSRINEQLVKPIQKIMYRQATTGATVADAEEELRTFITGNEKLGYAERYVNQIAIDSLNQYDGLINSKVFNEYDMAGYKYVGDKIKTTRAQCCRWIKDFGGTITREQLQEEIDWAYSNGSGMIPGTTPENFGAFRGGYRCRHVAIGYLDDLTEEELNELGV